MDDVIYRQDVLDALDITPLEVHDYELAVGVIKDIPSAQQWIPCSERLPEEFKRVLCCTDMREMFLARVYIFDDGNYSFDDEDGMAWEGNVVAWMPLPDCYQGDGNNEKIQRREYRE